MKSNVKAAKINRVWLRPSFRYFDFPEMLKWYMYEKNITSKELASRCGISEYLVRKAMGSNDVEWVPYLLPVVLGIGLELPASDIHALLGSTGYKIPDTAESRYQMLHYIIDMPYPKTVADCNKIMEEAGFKKLTEFGIWIPCSLYKSIPRRRRTK